MPASLTRSARLLSQLGDGASPSQTGLRRVLLVQWAEEDGKSASEWIARRLVDDEADPKVLRSAFKDVVSTWAHHDSSAALAWYRSNASIFDKTYAFDAVRALAPHELAAIPSLMGPHFKHVFDNLPEELAMLNQASDSLEQGYEAFATEEYTWSAGSILHALAEQWVAIDLQAASDWAADQSPGKHLDPLLGEIRKARLKTTEDTASVADSLLKEQVSVPKEKLLESITEQWPDEGLNDAGAWLASQSYGPESEPAIRVFAKRAVTMDPASAFAWLDTIEDEVQRARFYGDTFDHWHSNQPTEAETFLTEHIGQWPESRVRLLGELIISQVYDPSRW
jgi:hypothetical protein